MPSRGVHTTSALRAHILPATTAEWSQNECGVGRFSWTQNLANATHATGMSRHPFESRKRGYSRLHVYQPNCKEPRLDILCEVETDQASGCKSRSRISKLPDLSRWPAKLRCVRRKRQVGPKFGEARSTPQTEGCKFDERGASPASPLPAFRAPPRLLVSPEPWRFGPWSATRAACRWARGPVPDKRMPDAPGLS